MEINWKLIGIIAIIALVGVIVYVVFRGGAVKPTQIRQLQGGGAGGAGIVLIQ